MLSYVLAACIAMAALAVSLSHAMKRLRETGEMLEKAVARKQSQSERVRRAARACLMMRREGAAARRRKASIEMTCHDLEQRLKTIGSERGRLLVLDDRRTKADGGWLVYISNPDYASKVNSNTDPVALDGWRKGRRYIVWAMDEAKARDKINARFPDKRGFSIEKIEKYS